MKTATLALAFVAASSIAHADTPSSEPSTTLPEITVYPHPGALLIDRLSRQIITAIGSQARLPRLPRSFRWVDLHVARGYARPVPL